MTNNLDLKWKSLLKYYLECVTTENTKDICFYNEDENKKFIQLSDIAEWLSSERKELEVAIPKTNIFNAQRNENSNPIFYYGYPLYQQYVRKSKTGWTGTVIKPILFWPVEITRNDGNIKINRIFDEPKINNDFLKNQTNSLTHEENIAYIQEILNWNEDVSIKENLKFVINKIIEKDNLKFITEINFNKLDSHMDFSIDNKTGIVNKGIIFKHNADSKYTFGLERELNQLLKFNLSSGSKTGGIDSFNILEFMLSDLELEIKKDNWESEIVETTTLNEEQRNAVLSALHNKSTIVTGPPGTGKSQAAINTICNAILENKTVIFASQNKKAIEVVLDKISNTQNAPIVFYYNIAGKESAYVQKLNSAIKHALTLDKHQLEKEYEDYRNLIKAQQLIVKQEKERLNFVIEHRNSVENLEKEKENILLGLDNNLSDYIDKVDYSNWKKACKPIIILNKKVNSPNLVNIYDNFLSIFNFGVQKRLYFGSKQIVKLFNLESYFAGYTEDRIVNALLLLCSLKEKNNALENLLTKNRTDLVEDVNIIRETIVKSEKRIQELSPRLVDLHMYRRFNKIPPKTQNLLMQYSLLIERIEGDALGKNRQFMHKEKIKIFENIKSYFPVLAVTNLSINHICPLSKNIIDLLIIDESSQADIPSAIPLIYRAKKVLILGDDKQLPFVSSISSIDVQKLEQKYNFEIPKDLKFSYSKSLFDLFSQFINKNTNHVWLKDCYRSKKEIVAFSKKEYYNDCLNIVTDYSSLKSIKGTTQQTVAWRDVQGEMFRPSTGSAYNLKEAEVVINLIKEIVKNNDSLNFTLGVVTPFASQANKIRDLANHNFLAEVLSKIEFLSETVHKFQGDQRDIIIFSPVLSKGASSRGEGFLRSTENLFNVAITRARVELHIVGDKQACYKSSVAYLKNFVTFIDSLENSESKFQSPGEKLFFDLLTSNGIHTIPQLPINQYQIDLAIANNNPPIAIEIDGEFYHRNINNQHCYNDFKKDNNLNKLGWKVLRFWTYEIENFPEKCLDKVKSFLNSK